MNREIPRADAAPAAASQAAERAWDERLHIDTCGRDDRFGDDHHHPYEPTPYCVLERIARSGYLHPGDRVVDMGCGKGRTAFFLHSELGCSVIGIEREEPLLAAARDNLARYLAGRGLDAPEQAAEAFSGIWFFGADAESAEIPEADAFYFFNPFSVTLLRRVIGRIVDAFYTYGRAVKLFFYYPEDECVACLMTENGLEFFDDLDCRDLFGDDPRETVLVFGIG